MTTPLQHTGGAEEEEEDEKEEGDDDDHDDAHTRITVQSLA